jgi:hypothetical protein
MERLREAIIYYEWLGWGCHHKLGVVWIW